MGSDPKGFTATLEQMSQAMDFIEPDLIRRNRAKYEEYLQSRKGLLALVMTYPDLYETYRARVEELASKKHTFKVRVGDWVTINGWRFRIAALREVDGLALTERVRVDGKLVSSDWTHGTELVPDSTPPSESELETMAPCTAEERLARHRQRLIKQVVVPAGGPAPLVREGQTELREREWSTEVPEGDVNGAQLKRHWAFLLETRAARRAQLDESARTKHTDTSGLSRWIRERYTQIHYFEAVMSLLHRIVAPDAAYLCGADCNHLDRGLSREQLRRYQGSLAAFRASTDYESEENYTVERAANDLEHYVRGWAFEHVKTLGTRTWQLVRCLPGAEADDFYEVRVKEKDAVVETRAFPNKDAAKAFYDAVAA